jgi:hypothetical protein
MPNCEIVGKNPTLEQLKGEHSLQDVCSAKISRFDIMTWIRESKRHAQMRNRLGGQLADYEILEKGNYIPFSEFRSGIFCPDQYPHGTIIRVSVETLYLQNNAYGETKQFGFIVDTNGITKDGKNVVIYMKDGIVCGGDFQNIKIGEVRHQKMNSPKGKIIYNLVEKVNSVEIVLPGSGIKEKRRDVIGKPRVTFIPEFQV